MIRNSLLFFVVAFLTFGISHKAGAQAVGCFQIESVLVDACSSPEGENEMVLFQVGNTALNTSNLTVSWPNGFNPWRGICQNATTAAKVATLNATIQGCGWLLEPVGGVLPAGAKVLMITSTNFNTGGHNYANLSDTLYVIFQCSGNTSGHFANATSSGTRTLTMSFTNITGCTDAVTYSTQSLIDTTGQTGGSRPSGARDGATVEFTYAGLATYTNDGCNPPFIPLAANAGPDQSVCSQTSITLNGNVPGNYPLQWHGGNGSFSNNSNPSTNYSPSPQDSGTIQLFLSAFSSCDTVTDTMNLTILPLPEPDLGPDTLLCSGGSITLSTSAGSFQLWSTGAFGPSITVTTPGTYFVTALNGCGTGSDTIVVTGGTAPTANLGPDQVLCTGNNITLNPGAPGATHLWSTTSTQDSITVSTAGTYSVQVSNACGTDNDTINITGLSAPNFSLGQDTVICTGGNITLAPTGAAITGNYTWSNTSTGSSLTIGGPGLYWLEITNQCGTFRDSINVGAVPTPVLNIGPDLLLCDGDSVTLNAGTLGINYLWSTGATTDTLKTTTDGTYWVRVDYLCVTRSDTVRITTNNTPNFDLGPPINLCPGDSAILRPGLSNASYLWSNGDTTDSLLVSTSGIYWAEISNGCGVLRDSVTVTTNAVPTLNLGPDQTLCDGVSATLNAGAGASSYLWSNNTSGQTLPVSTAGLYWVEARYTCDTLRDSINISTETSPNFSFPATADLCPGDSLILSPGLNNANYLWSDNSTADTLRVTTAGLFWAQTSNVCDTIRDSIQVSLIPVPTLNLGPAQTLCDGASTTLNAGTGALSYTWSTGATTDTLLVSTGGLYWVEARYLCDTLRDTVLIVTETTPSISLGLDIDLCQGDSLTLFPNFPGVTWLWSTGSTADSITVRTAGLYWAQATNACGNDRDSINIGVINTPTLNLGTDQLLCDGATITLNAGSGAIGYTWSTGATTDTLLVSTAGSYWVETRYTCDTLRDTVDITTANTPSLNLAPNDTLCPGDTLTLDAGNPGANYLWSTSATTQTIIVTTTGTYTITVTTPCGADTSTQNVFVRPNPRVNAGPDDTLCLGNTLVLNGSAGTGIVQWSGGAGTFQDPTQQNTTYTPAAADSNGAILVLSLTTPCGTFRDSMILTVPAGLTGSISGPDTLCFGEPLILTYQGNATQFQWMGPGTFDPSANDDTVRLRYNTDGNLIIYLMYGDSCSSQMDSISVFVREEVTAGFTYDPDPPTATFPLQFTNTSSPNAITFAWDFGDGFTSDRTNPEHVFQDPGGSSVSLIATTEAGCSDTLTQSIVVLSPDTLVPNVFTPNGDGINDILEFQVPAHDRYELVIYDRWGKQMFRSTSSDLHWDGTYQGQPAPESVYYFILKVQTLRPENWVRTGNVTLLR